MIKTALITGAKGFVGSALCQSLQNDYQIINASHSDCLDLNSLRDCFDANINSHEIDVVYILGWSGVAVQSQRNSIDIQFNNVQSVVNLLNVLRAYKVRKIVFVGSVSELEFIFSFGKKEKLPLITCYGASKIYADTLTRYYCQERNISYSSGFISSIYGPGEISDKFICSSIKKLLNNEHLSFSSGNQLYDFVYIDDAILDLITLKEDEFNGQYIIGSGKYIPLKSFIHQMCAVFNKDTDEFRTFGSTGGESLDLSKLPYKLEFISNVANLKRTEFVEGIRKTADFLISQGVINNG